MRIGLGIVCRGAYKRIVQYTAASWWVFPKGGMVHEHDTRFSMNLL